jgi:hypothetical protein
MNSIYPPVQKPEPLGRCIRKDGILINSSLDVAQDKSRDGILVSFVSNQLPSIMIVSCSQEESERMGISDRRTENGDKQSISSVIR